MKKAPILSLCTTFLFVLSFARVEALTSGDFTYTESGGKVTITGYPPLSTGVNGTLTIPATIEGKPVVAIGSSAFVDCVGLRHVVVPEGVTSLGYSSFRGCLALTSISLPSTLITLRGNDNYYYSYYGAFYDCVSLSSIEIPSGVTEIPSYTFYGCQSLSSVTLSPNTTAIKESAFSGCSSLANIHLPTGLLSISSNAFYNCNSLSSIVLPDGLTSIDTSAFSDCNNLLKVSFPDSLLVIQERVFYSCDKLQDVEFGNGLITIGSYAFAYCNALKSITIPASVTNISTYAFYKSYGFYNNTCRFLGDAPVLGTSVFGSSSSNFIVEFYSGATGFTVPFWNSYYSMEISNYPEIVVEHPVNTSLRDSRTTLAFDALDIGSTAEKTVTVRNTGTVNLTNLDVTITGTNASEFNLGDLGSTTLAPGASATFTVTYRPTAEGSHSAELQIASNDSDENPFYISLSGAGVVPITAEIVVEHPTGTSLADGSATLAFGNTDIGQLVAKTVTVYNTGEANLTGLAVTLSGANVSDFALSALEVSTLATGESTSFTVTFAPEAAGSRSAALQITSNDLDESPFNISLNGTCVIPPTPEIVVEHPVGTNLVDGNATLTFGNAEIGKTLRKTVTVRNTGKGNLTGLLLTSAGMNVSDFGLGDFGMATLPPGASTTFTVAFTPSAAGTRRAALQISSNDANESPFNISLSGTGVLPPVPEIVVEYPFGVSLVDGNSSLSFGDVQIGGVYSVNRTVILRNTGKAGLWGLAATLSGLNASNFAVEGLITTTLAPGASTSFKVRFTPTAAGLRSAVLKIWSNDANEKPFDISLSGTGTKPKAPEITVLQGFGADKILRDNGSSRNFGTVNVGSTSTAMTFTIRNDGTAWLKNLSISFKGTYAKDFIVVKAPALSVAPGKSTQFKVIYKPLGSRISSATMKITSNDANENPFRVAVTGYGTK